MACPACGDRDAITLFNLVSCGNKSCRLFHKSALTDAAPRWTHNDPTDTYLGQFLTGLFPYDLYISSGLNHIMYRFSSEPEDYSITSVYDYRFNRINGKSNKEGFVAAYDAAVQKGYLLP